MVELDEDFTAEILAELVLELAGGEGEPAKPDSEDWEGRQVSGDLVRSPGSLPTIAHSAIAFPLGDLVCAEESLVPAPAVDNVQPAMGTESQTEPEPAGKGHGDETNPGHPLWNSLDEPTQRRAVLGTEWLQA